MVEGSTRFMYRIELRGFFEQLLFGKLMVVGSILSVYFL